MLLDLFAGRLGWSKAFLARRWKVVAVDLVRPPEVPEGVEFIQCNIEELGVRAGHVVRDFHTEYRHICMPDFIVASSPCTEFSTMLNFRPPVPYPKKGVELFKYTQKMLEELGAPYVMENVAGAQRFVGKSVRHAGSFHLWGNAVPPILPVCRKGMTELAMGLREHKGKPGWDERPNGKRGKTDAAHVAMIPAELANCVADYAERILGR